MIQLRRSAERGHANHGWLDSFHTFSFADFYDPSFMGFRELRVINEDRIQGGSGFPTHGHQDMEIVTYLVEGALEHEDTLGNKAVMRPGEIQRMSAGTGIRHSEYNHLRDTQTHFLQIWIKPEKHGVKPSYGQKSFADELAKEELTLMVSREGRDGSVSINQDVEIYAAKWMGPREIKRELRPGRYAWVQVVRGKLALGAVELSAGDGAAVGDESHLHLRTATGAEFLLFDLP